VSWRQSYECVIASFDLQRDPRTVFQLDTCVDVVERTSRIGKIYVWMEQWRVISLAGL
jgi:hypothetical protein